MDQQTRALLDRTGFDMQLIRDEQKRINTRLDSLCSQMNQFCGEVRELLGAMGGQIVEPSSGTLPEHPQPVEPTECKAHSVPQPVEPTAPEPTPHTACGVLQPVKTKPVEIELDITSGMGLTAGPRTR